MKEEIEKLKEKLKSSVTYNIEITYNGEEVLANNHDVHVHGRGSTLLEALCEFSEDMNNRKENYTDDHMTEIKIIRIP